jgi:hypothetical protein
VKTKTFRKFAAGAALAMLAVLPACAFPGGTPGGTGPDDFPHHTLGLGVVVRSGSSAVDLTQACSWAPTTKPHEIAIGCDNIGWTIPISYVVAFEFPNKNYTVTVSASGLGLLYWEESGNDSNNPDFGENHGVLFPDGRQVVLTGGSTNAVEWRVSFRSWDITASVDVHMRVSCVPVVQDPWCPV